MSHAGTAEMYGWAGGGSVNWFAGCSVGFLAALVHRVSGLESTRVIELFVDAESSVAFRPKFGKIFLTKRDGIVKTRMFLSCF